jgi:hypothetical protein
MKKKPRQVDSQELMDTLLSKIGGAHNNLAQVVKNLSATTSAPMSTSAESPSKKRQRKVSEYNGNILQLMNEQRLATELAYSSDKISKITARIEKAQAARDKLLDEDDE